MPRLLRSALRTRLMIPAVVALGAGVIPQLFSRYDEHLALIVMCYAIAVIGLDILVGRLGLLSFGQSAFLATGAYVTVLLQTQFNVSFPIAFGIAVLCTGGIAALIAIPAMRLPGFSFALVTFGLAYVTNALLTGNLLFKWLGGSNGLFVPSPRFFGSVLNNDGLYYVALALLLTAMIVSANIERSKTGWAMATVKQSEAVASALGIRVNRFKVAVFALAAVFAAVAGVLLALASGVISPGTYSLDQSIVLLAMLTLGGKRGNLGPILGSAFFVLLPEYLQGVQDNSAIVFALTFIAILMLAPGGVVGLGRKWMRRRQTSASKPSSVVVG